ncbi:MAG TPA: tetratricopeptide repeat protein [Thermoanaerobaculia bacterium]|nr:tetratricopeptide repeat protein [Thermoanaerobaculia bacterium]
MSRSPHEAVGPESAADYLAAFATVFRMHELGRSFSGYERNCAFLNTGSPRFANVSAVSGLDFIDDGRGLAYVDWDQDGDLDLWFANRTAPRLRFARNDSPGDAHYLALRLTGRTSNRDAIGARVEVHVEDGSDRPRVMVETLRAGDGFLSQSSKWLHFGLGPHLRIEKIAVRWPGGARETLPGVAADARYSIVEGDGRAQRWIAPERQVSLRPSAPATTPSRTPRRLYLVARAPLPTVQYETAAGRAIPLEERVGAPTLINLWASWCPPCIEELRDLTRNEARIRAAGLDVIALSVDGLEDGATTGPEDARRVLAATGFPFETGFANPELLTKLEVLHDLLSATHLPFAIPSSLLLDGDARLAGFYRGPVELERLLEDVEHLGSPSTVRRAMAVPFPGRWFAAPGDVHLSWIAQRFLDDGWLDDAIRYLRLSLETEDDDAEARTNLGHLLFRKGELGEASRLYRHALRLDPDHWGANRGLADLLATQDRWQEATVFYEQAIRAASHSAETRHNYGRALERLGRLDDAAAQFREILRRDPLDAGAHNNLAALLLLGDVIDDAVVHLQRAIELDPDLADAHNNLGTVRFRQGRIEEAIEHLRRAVELDPALQSARDNLSLAERAISRR